MKKNYKFVGGVLVAVFCGAAVFWAIKSGRFGFSGAAAQVPQPWLPVGEIVRVDRANAAQGGEVAFVTRVIDGDTIEAQVFDPATGEPAKATERVRYIGMDTPETVDPQKPVECYGHEASVRDKALVEGEYVLLVKDATDRDKYGRLLRFVYLLRTSSAAILSVATTSIDLELVAEGYARVLTIPPNTAHEADFKAAAAAAKAAKLGFWGACPSYPFE